MNRIAIVGLCFLLTGCGGPANVYDLPASEAYKKLAAVETNTSAPPFGDRRITTDLADGKSLRWTAVRMGVTSYCTADVLPEGADRTRVDVSCGGDGQYGPVSGSQWRPFVIELVDATLRGRPYAVESALDTASGYPPDPNDAVAALGANPPPDMAANRAAQEYERAKADWHH